MSIVLEKKDAGEWWCQLYFEEGKPYRMKVKFNVRTTTTTSTATTAAATDDITQAEDFHEEVTEDPEFYTDEEYRNEWDDNNPTKLKQVAEKDAEGVGVVDDSGNEPTKVTNDTEDEYTEISDGAGDTSSSNGGVQEALSNFDEPLSKGKGGKQKSSSDDGGKQSISSSSSAGSQSISSSSSGGGSQSISSSSSGGGTQSISSSSSGGGKTSVSVSGGGEKSISVSGDGHKKVAVDGQVVHDSYDDYERKRL